MTTTGTALVCLGGSARQVAWATQVRAQIMAGAAAVRAERVARLAARGVAPEKVERQMGRFDAGLAAAAGITEAGWWLRFDGYSSALDVALAALDGQEERRGAL